MCVDISPSPTKDVSGFQEFIAAMKAVDIPKGIPRSTARRMAEEQLRPTIQVQCFCQRAHVIHFRSKLLYLSESVEQEIVLIYASVVLF